MYPAQTKNQEQTTPSEQTEQTVVSGSSTEASPGITRIVRIRQTCRRKQSPGDPHPRHSEPHRQGVHVCLERYRLCWVDVPTVHTYFQEAYVCTQPTRPPDQKDHRKQPQLLPRVRSDTRPVHIHTSRNCPETLAQVTGYHSTAGLGFDQALEAASYFVPREARCGTKSICTLYVGAYIAGCDYIFVAVACGRTPYIYIYIYICTHVCTGRSGDYFCVPSRTQS